jgi:hypothetical protein
MAAAYKHELDGLLIAGGMARSLVACCGNREIARKRIMLAYLKRPYRVSLDSMPRVINRRPSYRRRGGSDAAGDELARGRKIRAR